MKIKTYKQWEKSELDLDEFLQPGDYIDEQIYLHLGEIVPANFSSYGFVQCGEPYKKEDEIYYHMTAMQFVPDSKFMYLGIIPEFKND